MPEVVVEFVRRGIVMEGWFVWGEKSGRPVRSPSIEIEYWILSWARKRCVDILGFDSFPNEKCRPFLKDYKLGLLVKNDDVLFDEDFINTFYGRIYEREDNPPPNTSDYDVDNIRAEFLNELDTRYGDALDAAVRGRLDTPACEYVLSTIYNRSTPDLMSDFGFLNDSFELFAFKFSLSSIYRLIAEHIANAVESRDGYRPSTSNFLNMGDGPITCILHFNFPIKEVHSDLADFVKRQCSMSNRSDLIAALTEQEQKHISRESSEYVKLVDKALEFGAYTHNDHDEDVNNVRTDLQKIIQNKFLAEFQERYEHMANDIILGQPLMKSAAKLN